jgi:hypothetical protein
VYKKATDIYMLILCPATLLKVCIRSKNLQVESLGSFKYRIMSSTNRDSLISSFPIFITFVYCSCPMALAMGLSTILKSGENGHLCLILDFKGNVLVFTNLV